MSGVQRYSGTAVQLRKYCSLSYRYYPVSLRGGRRAVIVFGVTILLRRISFRSCQRSLRLLVETSVIGLEQALRASSYQQNRQHFSLLSRTWNNMDIEHFENYDLAQSQILQATLLFSSILLAFFFLGKIFVTEQKRFAWLISLLNSFVMMILGFVYLSVKIPVFDGLFSWGDDAVAIFHEQTSNFTALTCLWFAIANIIDLVLGSIYYRKQLGVLTAYIHHSAFIWIMLACTTGNGIFMTMRPFSGTFAVCLIEELPTFLLALGSIFPACRSDYGFGLSFFALRILYHAYFMSFAFKSWVDPPILILFVGTFSLHFFWFKTWINKYGFYAPSKISQRKHV